MELCGFPNQSKYYACPGQQKGGVHKRKKAENGRAHVTGTMDGDARLWLQTIIADQPMESRRGDMPDKRTFPILLGCFGRGECLYLQIASNIFIQRLENTLRKIIVSMRVTLDGFIAGPHGEMD